MVFRSQILLLNTIMTVKRKDLAVPDVNTEWILAISLLCCTMVVT